MTTFVKTEQLTGAALDYAVAKACKLPVEIHPECCGFGLQTGYGSPPECCANPIYYVYWKEGRRYEPSSDLGSVNACRIIVHAWIGDEVEIPDELLP